MPHSHLVTRASLCAIAWLASTTAHAQCMEWSSRFTVNGPNNRVQALCAHDDGSGPALYAGGFFSSVGDTLAANVARWDGAQWTEVGDGGLGSTVYALAVFDDGLGGGPMLYAGGNFSIRRWDGVMWSNVGGGVNSTVYSLAVADLGGGPALYAGGLFTIAGGMSAERIARWDGTSWSALGSGINGRVEAIAMWDDGGGPALYAGGNFSTAGGVSASSIAKWDGSTWSALGTGLKLQRGSLQNGVVSTLKVFDDGGGAQLCVGGRFTSAGGGAAENIARWNGASWSTFASGVDRVVSELEIFDDGSGPALHIAGDFTTGGSPPYVHNVAKWNGASWVDVGSGINGYGMALIAFDDGSGPTLFFGGDFSSSTPDGRALNLARWNGAQWAPLTTGDGLEGILMLTLAPFDEGLGQGRLLYAGELDGFGFTQLGQWNGNQWSSETLPGWTYAMQVFDGLTAGPALYAGGYLGNAFGESEILRRTGGAWSSVGAVYWSPSEDEEPSVYAMVGDASLGGGPALYVGGKFDVATGVAGANHVARWNGTSWSKLATGVNDVVLALATIDFGGGTALYAGGQFTSAGGTSASRVARWDGASWSALSTGTNGNVHALCAFDDGSGLALYAGGAFTIAGGISASRVARWDGAAWSALGAGVDGEVRALTVFDDGSGGGPALFAAGFFANAGGSSASRVAKWDGAAWSALGTGILGNNVPSGVVHALAAYDDGLGGGADLYAGGAFDRAGDRPSALIAQWFGCEHDGASYCAGDDLDPLVTADCPCGNFGEANHGCGNFPFTNGARMTASGTTNPNTILFTCTDLPNNTLCTFLRGGNNVAAGFVFGDGVRCVQTPLLRFGQQNSGVGGNPPNTAITATLVEAPGVTRYYQCQYRNPVGGWCDPGLFNVSNGYRLSW